MITLYSTNCPRCKILEQKLRQKNIDFQIESDMKNILNLGFRTSPILQIEDKYYEFGEAVKWVNAHED